VLKIVVGARELLTGNREQGTGNREQGTGNREQGTGNRKRVLSDFTFLHIPLNFSVHLLRNANLITCNSDVTWNGALRCR
jgi:hypothetical protein